MTLSDVIRKIVIGQRASETLTGVTQSKIGDVYWRASEASETLSGVTQSRFRYIYLFIGERAKRARHYQG